MTEFPLHRRSRFLLGSLFALIATGVPCASAETLLNNIGSRPEVALLQTGNDPDTFKALCLAFIIVVGYHWWRKRTLV